IATGQFDIKANPYPTDYVIQFVRSPNTGEFQMLVAIRFDDVARALKLIPESTNRCQRDISVIVRSLPRDLVQVLVARPPSVISPVLPPGYGFAIFDQFGTVQLHSEEVRNGEENFFQETDGDPFIPSVLSSGRSEHHHLKYMGENREVYITSLTGVSEQPMGLVVFRDTRLDQTAQLATLLFSAALLIPILIFIASIIVVIARTSGYANSFLWPQNDRGASYLLLAATNTTVILMFVQWVTLWSPQVIICSSVFIPIFGLFAAIVNRESSTKARSFPQYLLLSGSVALI